MTRYELKLEKKHNKKIIRDDKKLARKLKRKETKKQRAFDRKSNAKYRWYQRVLVKILRVGGPISGFGYAAYQLYDSLFLNLHDIETVVPAINLRNLSILLIAGTILFGFAVHFGFKYIKTSITANAVARNQGQPSLSYSPIIVTAVRALLSSWIFGLLYLFNYIGINYGETLHNGFEHALIAFIIGFGLLLLGDLVEQGILNNVRNRKHNAEHESRQMLYDMSTRLDAVEETVE